MWSERLGFAIVLGGSPSVCGQNVSGLLLFLLGGSPSVCGQNVSGLLLFSVARLVCVVRTSRVCYCSRWLA